MDWIRSPWFWLAGAAGVASLAFTVGGVGMYSMAYAAGEEIGAIWISKVDGVWMPDALANAWRRMKAAAAADGITLVADSGFRTMAEQVVLYAKYMAGGTTAAVPGHSNHQSGRALDVAVHSSWTSPESLWLDAHAGEYGFSRDEGHAVNEPWHMRFIA